MSSRTFSARRARVAGASWTSFPTRPLYRAPRDVVNARPCPFAHGVSTAVHTRTQQLARFRAFPRGSALAVGRCAVQTLGLQRGGAWMRIGWGASAVLGVALLAAAPARAQELAVRQTGPEGEVTDIEQANEIRVTFSEPMVVLGRIPQPVVAPFFRIDPAVEGTFRWSGTKLLIFTPARRLPYASKYTVTLAAGATSILGHKLASPHTFSFTTPTLRLMEVRWERQDTRVDSPVILALRFNQPVKPLAAARHISVRYAPRKWDAPELPAEALDRLRALDPAAEA